MSAIENISRQQRFFLFSQGVFHFLLAVFVTSTIWMMAYNRNWELLHTWHMFLCTVGVSLLMSQGIALFNPGNTFVLGCNSTLRGFLHGALTACGGLALIVGVSLKIQDKIDNNRTHFESVHAITGLVSYLLTFVSLIGGVLLYFIKVLFRMCNLKPILLKSSHIFFGISAYVLGVVSLCYGLRNYFAEASDTTRTGLIVILCIYAGLNVLRPLKSMFRL